MQPDPNIRALSLCGQQCLQASNGHGRRWAVARCTASLVATGTPPAIALGSAEAMRNLAQHLAGLVAQGAGAAAPADAGLRA